MYNDDLVSQSCQKGNREKISYIFYISVTLGLIVSFRLNEKGWEDSSGKAAFINFQEYKKR